MSNKIEDIPIKNRTYYFFNDITNIEIFDPVMREKSYLLFWIFDDPRFKICIN